MKMKSLFSGILMAATLALGIGAAVSFESKSNNDVKVAEAASTTFYFDATSTWNYDGAKFAIWAWGNNVTAGAFGITNNISGNLFSFNLDDGYTGFKFFRLETSKYEDMIEWQYCPAQGQSGVWGLTGDEVRGTNVLFTITSYSDGDWSTPSGYGEIYEVASTTPTASTKRIWVNPKDNFFDGGARAALRVFGDGITTTNYILGGSSQFVNMTHESNLQYYFYVDIPVDADCQLVRLHDVCDWIWTYSANFSSVGSWNTTLFMYSWDAAASLSAGGLDSADNYTVEFAKKFLDGYSTCESSDVNGYGAYSNINANVLSKLNSTKMSELRSATFSAPTYGTRTYGDKIDLMANPRASGRPIMSNISDDNSMVLVVTVAVLTMSRTFPL